MRARIGALEINGNPLFRWKVAEQDIFCKCGTELETLEHIKMREKSFWEGISDEDRMALG